ncbi:hypothetical protein [Rodentibacter heidelbergensis]|uniref:Uncharacterized protein n=1 Tax=Rodentibacter heidelbergensis TaxID=1908258 RepID=A0A1V3IC96_9PAST|nr:hypothetical protein [Rodentibacter heidelbergensis]OOF37387.1 hypothetical protein BKK48_02145 [Rodentibacter heidelbergensis]
MITLFLVLISVPVYLVIAGLIIGGTYFINILPMLLPIYLIIVFLVYMFTPLKPWFNKHQTKINTIGKLLTLILFGPLIVVLAVAILALPFVIIYAIADNPFLWYAIILFFIGIFAYNTKKDLKRKREKQIWKETQERAAMHKFFYRK